MGNTFHIQEKLYHYQDIYFKDALKWLEHFEWKRDLINFRIPLSLSLNIPFIHEQPFYAVRIVPYFHHETCKIDIPTIAIHGKLSEDEEVKFLFENKDCTLEARYNRENPGFFIETFLASYDYICYILSNLLLSIQVAEHQERDVLSMVSTYYYIEKYGISVGKDGVQSSNGILRNKSVYHLDLHSISFTREIQTFSRTQFFSVAYPIYRSLLLLSFATTYTGAQKLSMWWISYDDGFYRKLGVPTFRQFWCILDCSGKIEL